MENKNFDFIIIGAGPAGIFAALEMAQKRPQSRVLIVDTGRAISHRACPARIDGQCKHCDPCAIVHGWAGAGAFSDGKLSLSDEVGGHVSDYIGHKRAMDYIHQADDIYLSFGASKTVHGLNNSRVDEIAYEASRYNIRLVPCPVRHLGTENAGPVLGAMHDYLVTKPNTTFLELTSAEDILCLVTGRHAPLARLHPNIKGVAGAQSSGAALVSFNGPAFCSYEHEQGSNAPTSEYAAFAYTTALNTLLADRNHVCRVGDTTIVFWADGSDSAYQDCAMFALFGGEAEENAAYQEADLFNVLKQLSQGRPVDWDDSRLDPDTRFYILGLAPNAARLSVRFFWQNSFGGLAAHLAHHYEQLNIIRPAFAQGTLLTIWRMALETVRKPAPGSRAPEPAQRLAGDLLLAVLNDTPYPATLLNGVQLRIRAQQDITWGQAAILKAYYKRNSANEQIKEVMDMKLNDQSDYLPYVLGRLFSVLESIQRSASPGINTTIKNRYFNAASATPALVFPTLINLAQKHLNKLDGGLAAYYEKRLAELHSLITETLPARMTLDEQSAFQIGYYHETQNRYTKKEEK